MATWNWDFGFDWASAIHPAGNTENRRYLFHGFVDSGKSVWRRKDDENGLALAPPGSPFGLAKDDRLSLFFYDLSRNSAVHTDVSLFAMIELVDAFTGNDALMLDAGARFTVTPTSTAGATQRTSTIFSVVREGSPPPFNCYFQKESDGLPTEYKVVVSGGRYLMTVELIVTLTENKNTENEHTDTRRFWVDPEMVVGGMPEP